MRVKIVALGRLKTGAERALVEDYGARFDKLGKGMGFGPLEIVELDDRKGGGKAGEADLILRALSNDTFAIALDERGDQIGSPEFASLLARCRDDGQNTISFVIGGADGLHKSVLDRSQRSLSFGKMVWPHMLARVLLCEQLYRATTILAGTPYHRA
ncbi:MAG: 23S rRNA (pseudouridine(1915)-N(3))-methyltransferase RlmH [Paracoccaceae bacterium]